MRLTMIVLVSAAVCTGFASAQTSAQPEQDRIFKFAHAETEQQTNEIGTLVRSIGDIVQVSVDVAQARMNVHGTADDIALASWLFNELDRPVEQLPPPTQPGVVLQYRMPVEGDNVVRIFYVPYAKTLQEFQEVVTCVRSTSSIRRLFTYNATRAAVTRATADKTALAEWLFNGFGQPASATSGSPTYRITGDKDDTVQMFHLSRPKSVQDFQEVATLIRSISDVRYLFTYNARLAFAVRGSSDRIALAAWLVNELDRPTLAAASTEYFIPEGNENAVRVFYLANTATVQQFQDMAVSIRGRTSIRRVFTYNSPRALALRGTPAQIAQAAQLLANRANAN